MECIRVTSVALLVLLASLGADALAELGCFKDTGNRDLTGSWTNGPEMTNEVCINRCKRMGFKYAATQYARHCFCGNSYNKYGVSTSCNMKCAADPTENCGGPWSNRVFRLDNDNSNLVGCYRDNAARALDGFASSSGQDMSNEKCIDTCKALGYKYAGTENSRECYCGNSYDKYGEYDKCISKCSGEATSTCGGPWALSVYRTGLGKDDASKMNNVQIQSKNYPTNFFGSADASEPFAFKIGPPGNAFKFNVISPGLTGEEGTVSFKSADRDASFLRHFGFHLVLEDREDARNPDLFKEDATFRLKEDKFFDGYFAIESVNYPGRYIRHQGYTLKLHEEEASDLYKNDASFRISRPDNTESFSPVDVSDAQEVGCFRDTGNRALRTFWIYSQQMTNPTCQRICKGLKTKYAATQAGGHCFCGESYDRYGAIDNCNSNCPGDATDKCGGGWANRVFRVDGKAVVTAEAEAVGCFRDAGQRAMTGQWTNGREIDNDVCMQRCGDQGFAFYATQYASHCFCGDSYDKYGPFEGKCTMNCAADPTQKCGGGWANSVSKITNQAVKRVGCYRDNGARALDDYHLISPDMTLEFCSDICKGLGYKYSGNENSRECYCGNEYEKYGEYDKCITPCTGNTKAICGGPWALTVLRTGSSGDGVGPDVGRVEYKGCFRDAGLRALDEALVEAKGKMTNELCQKICKAKGTKYAATQARYQCYCGNDFRRYAEATNCDMPCDGDTSSTCGGSWANQVYQLRDFDPAPAPAAEVTPEPTEAPTPVPKGRLATPLGCYRDNADRALKGQWTNGPDMTVEKCITRCARQGFLYAALQYSAHCFCGNEYDKYGKYDQCNMKCSGNKNEICGGPWANQVYKIEKREIEQIGCFRDNGQRALHGLNIISDQFMTNHKCVGICKSLGFMFAGTEAGRECYCGNEYDKYGAYDKCTVPCTGEKESICGGPWALTVFRTGLKQASAPEGGFDFKEGEATELGCFRDSGVRALTGFWTRSNKMTNKMCQSLCRELNYKYAATQAAQHCFCGDNENYDRFGYMTNCNSPCVGDRLDQCGGGWANRIFQVAGKPERQFTATELGCFRDNGARDLTGQWTNGVEINSAVCNARCAAQGFKYAATQYSRHCFCGDTYGKYGKYDKCNMKCVANQDENCGGPWANRVFELSTSHSGRVGCFRDNAARALADFAFASPMMTIELCRSTCGAMGYKFSGTENSQECYCGNEYDKYGAYDKCVMPCSGDKNNVCGGPWALTVFKTGVEGGQKDTDKDDVPEAEFMGCYKDAGLRAMSLAYVSTPLMTPEMCQTICRGQNAKYAGTESGKDCFCGNEYRKYGSATNCNIPCAGDKTRFCGGGWALQVYQIRGDVHPGALAGEAQAEAEPEPAPEAAAPKPVVIPEAPAPQEPVVEPQEGGENVEEGEGGEGVAVDGGEGEGVVVDGGEGEGVVVEGGEGEGVVVDGGEGEGVVVDGGEGGEGVVVDGGEGEGVVVDGGEGGEGVVVDGGEGEGVVVDGGEGGEGEVPAEGEEGAVPAEGEGALPAEGEEGEVPAEGEGAVPAEGEEGALPAEGEEGAVPAEGEGEVPAEGEEGEVPAEGEEGEVPAEGEEGEVPAEGEEGALPAEGEEGAVPAEGEGEVPAEGEEGEVPAEGEEGELPEEGEEGELPEEGEEGELPAEGEEVVVGAAEPVGEVAPAVEPVPGAEGEGEEEEVVEEPVVVDEGEVVVEAVDPEPAVEPVPEVGGEDNEEPIVAEEGIEEEVQEVTCKKERAKFAKNGLSLEPAFGEDCLFLKKQCDGEKCVCVHPKKGKVLFKGIKFPLSEDFDCNKKPKHCLKTRFKALMKSPVPDFIAECNKAGKYNTKQCHEGECWCVRARKGGEIKKTRTTGVLTC